MDKSILEVIHLHKQFGDNIILNDVSFELYQGEVLGLMGASGSGKSVILKMIIGLLKPDRGEIRFENVDLTRLPEREFSRLRARIGYVFQNGALFDSLTVEENLSYPLERHTQYDEETVKKLVNERLALVGLVGTNKKFPSELSGGMLKRAGLLRATMLDPKITLFDEPTSGLDPINIENFIHNITDFRRTRGITGIFVSHDPASVLAICDRVAILWDGDLRIESTATIRKSTDPVIRSFIRPGYEEAGYGQTA